MRTVAVRAAAVAVLLIGLFAGLGTLPVQATTASVGYTCTLPVVGDSTFQVTSDTNAPGTVYLGTTFTPKLTTRAVVPATMVALMSSKLKATAVDGTVTEAVTTNGVATPVTQTIPRTVVPTAATATMTMVGTGKMAAISPKAAGTTTYRPGDLVYTLNFYGAASTTPLTYKGLVCVMPATATSPIDKVLLARSPSRTVVSAAYAKSAKKLTATATVAATSKVSSTGTVSVALLRGATKVKSVKASLAHGRATAAFAGITKTGAYKVVVTYAGSTTVLGSSASKVVTVR